MPRLPIDLRSDSVLSTPQNFPVVVLPPVEPGPKQLPLQAIEPEWNQFQRARKLQFTGRGVGMALANVPSLGALGSYQVWTTPPIPFRAFVRNLLFWNHYSNYIWFCPFACGSKVDGNYAFAALPNFSKMLQGTWSTYWPHGFLQHYSGFGQQIIPLNYLMGGLNMRLGVAQYCDGQTNPAFNYVFDVLEVADEP
jgi:hypothetical protein